MLSDVNRQILILSRRIHRDSPIMVVFEDSESSQNALRAAMMICLADNPLCVLILAKSSDEARLKQVEAENILAPTGLQASYRWLPEIDSTRLALIARREQCEVVVLPEQGQAFLDEDVIRILTESDCAVLLGR
jgi:hypothetical protein